MIYSTRPPGPTAGDVARASLVALVLIVAVSPTALAQRARSQVEKGNELYRAGKYDEAHQHYLDALRHAPDLGAIRFNDGDALYKSKDFQRALDAYRAAVESGDKALQARAWYNMGNALYQQQQLDGAADAYKQALRLDPNDTDAKYNLERVLRVKKQQQQQPQRSQQNKQNQNQQQNQQGQGQQQQQDQQRQAQQQNQAQQQQGQQNQAQEGQQGKQQPGQAAKPGQMTKEEAERLLQAIHEDPNKVQRQHAKTAVRRRPIKDW